MKRLREHAAPNAPGRWSALVDDLLRGIAHALSNRIAALMAHADGVSGSPASDRGAALSPEITKLLEINRLLRLLPASVNGRSEGLLLEDVLSDAIALFAVHPRGRELEWPVTSTNVQPVRAERWALLRIFLLLLDGARASGEEGGPGVEILVEGNEREVAVQIRRSASGDGAPSMDLTGYESELSSLLTRTGAALAVDRAAGCITVTLLSLAELRRRDRNGGGESPGAARGRA